MPYGAWASTGLRSLVEHVLGSWRGHERAPGMEDLPQAEHFVRPHSDHPALFCHGLKPEPLAHDHQLRRTATVLLDHGGAARAFRVRLVQTPDFTDLQVSCIGD